MSDWMPVVTRRHAAARVLAVGVLVIVVLAACRDGAGREQVQKPTVGVSLHPSPAPSGYGVWGRPGGVEPLMLTSDDLRAWSLHMTMDTAGDDVLSPCGLTEAEEQWIGGGYLREWESGEGSPRWMLVEQYSVPFSRNGKVLSAGEVVALIRAENTCETYTSREGTSRLTGEISLPKDLPGVEATFGFCERIGGGRGKESRACVGYLAREEVVSKVRVRTSEGANAERLLRELLPVAAEALAKA